MDSTPAYSVEPTQLLSPAYTEPSPHRFRFLDLEASASEASEDEEVLDSQVSNLFASQEEVGSPSDLRRFHAQWEEEADAGALARLFRRRRELTPISENDEEPRPAKRMRVKEKVKPLNQVTRAKRRKSRSAPPPQRAPQPHPATAAKPKRKPRRSSILSPLEDFSLSRSIPLPDSGKYQFLQETTRPFTTEKLVPGDLRLHGERYALCDLNIRK
jgi:hypothetical protein